MKVDSVGSIYILDSDNARVTKWEVGATIGSVVAGGNAVGVDVNQLGLYSSGLYVEKSTSIVWIADTNNNRIVRWPDPSTGQIVYDGSSGATLLFKPYGLFIDESDSDTLYIADTGNHHIQVLRTNATSATTVAGIRGLCGHGLNQLCFPQTLIVDIEKNMFIVDTGNNRIMRWKIDSTSGEVIAGDTTVGVMPYQLFKPTAISFDSDGDLFVVDTGNNRLQKFAVSCCKLYTYNHLLGNDIDNSF